MSMTPTRFEFVYERFQPIRLPPTNENSIIDLQNRTNVTFPKKYREYLLQYNGALFNSPGPLIDAPSNEYPQPRLEWIYGIGAPHPSGELGNPKDLSLWDGNDPPILYPIGYTEGGFFILLITEPADDYGCIYLRTFESLLFNTENKSHYLSENIEEFFGLLI